MYAFEESTTKSTNCSKNVLKKHQPMEGFCLYRISIFSKLFENCFLYFKGFIIHINYRYMDLLWSKYIWNLVCRNHFLYLFMLRMNCHWNWRTVYTKYIRNWLFHLKNTALSVRYLVLYSTVPYQSPKACFDNFIGSVLVFFFR